MLAGDLEALTGLSDRVTSAEEANFDCRSAWLRRIYWCCSLRASKPSSTMSPTSLLTMGRELPIISAKSS
jgi:hypothetical protein